MNINYSIMKRIEYIKHGSPDVLQVKNFELPSPSENEIQIQTSFAGINFADIMSRMGLYPGCPKPPHPIGAEASGVINKVGKNVKDFKIGDAVMTFVFFNGYSSHINIDANLAMKLPEHFSLSDGGAFPLVYMTAYMMMFDLGNLQKDEIFFIQGAGGGVGTAAIQLAKSVGAKIIGTSSKWKHKKLYEMGVDLCIDYYNENVRKKIMDFTNGYGVDLIVDPVGGKQWSESYKTLAPMGKLIVYGNQNLVTGQTRSIRALIKEFFNMPKIKPFEMIGANKSVMGYHLGKLKGAEHKVKKAMEKLLKMTQKDSTIKPVIDSIFPFEDASKAHQHIQDKKNFGKVLLDFTKL